MFVTQSRRNYATDHSEILYGVVLKLHKALGEEGESGILTFSYKGRENQVSSYVIFFNLIFNKYKFYHINVPENSFSLNFPKPS